MLQSQALDILKLGHNTYLTGAAGSGKTHVLNQFIKYLKVSNIRVGVTASTGIAATHVQGMTIHAWAGLGVQDELSDADKKKILANTKVTSRISETKVLIIDEVSMLHGRRLDMVDQICRAIKNVPRPFGGIQVVLCGDLFQLPPVTKGGKPDFIFNASAWQNMNLKVCYLSEQHRQDDSRLLDILEAIRGSSIEDRHYEYLQDRFRPSPTAGKTVRLYTHNARVDEINRHHLDLLSTKTMRYHMTSSGNQRAKEGLIKSCLAPETLELKLGAEVMFVANSPSGQYVNGTLGKVAGFDDDDLPLVDTGKKTIGVQLHNWKVEDGDKVLTEISQLPLRLAWAITVHKSQGMSLDAAEIDLSSSFEPGMGYVALSRTKSLDGMYIIGMNNTALMVSPEISSIDKRLRAKSDQARNSIDGMAPTEVTQKQRLVFNALQSDDNKMLNDYDLELFGALKAWRSKQAKTQSLPAYMVLADATLKYIAAMKPESTAKLSSIKGIGAKKLESYGRPLIDVVKEHSSQRETKKRSTSK